MLNATKPGSRILLVFSLAIALHEGTRAQNVGINNTGAAPNPYAVLDVDVTTNDKGLLIPRLSTAQRTSIAGLGLTEEGLMVYDNTTTSFWYWDGAQWVEVQSKRAWQLQGNAGTTPGTDFLGTTGPQDLVIKTSNTEAMRVMANGDVGIGTAAPAHQLQVQGDVRFVGDFVNQEALGAVASAVQNIPFTNAITTPINGTMVGITIIDGSGVNNSSVFISGFARVHSGALNSASTLSMGGYFILLQRDVTPAFSTPVNLTYTTGTCFMKFPNGLGSGALAFGGGGHVSYIDGALAPGTYYYRLAFYANGVSLNTGTYDVYERTLNVLQVKR